MMNYRYLIEGILILYIEVYNSKIVEKYAMKIFLLHIKNESNNY